MTVDELNIFLFGAAISIAFTFSLILVITPPKKSRELIIPCSVLGGAFVALTLFSVIFNFGVSYNA